MTPDPADKSLLRCTLRKSAETVAKAYGPNVSKGILAMEARIVELEEENKKLRVGGE